MKLDKKPDHFEVLRTIDNNPNITQRELAYKLGFSLGKINYCISALKIKGLIKINNFKKNQNKLNYFYLLTPKGIVQKTDLTIKFMKVKMKEYDELQKEFKIDQEFKKNKRNKKNK